MIQLRYLSAVHFSGPDAGSFLQAQLTADISALADGQSTFAAYCSPQGKVFGLLLIGRQKNKFVVIGSVQLLPSIVQRLRIYIFRSEVEIKTIDTLPVYGVLPSHSAKPAISLLAPPDIPLQYAIAGEGEQSDGAIDCWQHTELDHGIAWLDANTTEKFIPQMLGYDQIGAVSFSKGCYPGQEIVARAHYLGKVKRKPLFFTVSGQTEIENGSAVQVQYKTETINGTLIDSAPAPGNHTLLFIVTRTSEEKSPLSVNHEGRSYFSATI